MSPSLLSIQDVLSPPGNRLPVAGGSSPLGESPPESPSILMVAEPPALWKPHKKLPTHPENLFEDDEDYELPQMKSLNADAKQKSKEKASKPIRLCAPEPLSARGEQRINSEINNPAVRNFGFATACFSARGPRKEPLPTKAKAAPQSARTHREKKGRRSMGDLTAAGGA